jgi:D-3-phosphoglycerate dehydrogenase / 2-oxoglutarate reductase
MTKILVLDEIPAAGIDVLRSQGAFEVQEICRDEPEEIRKALGTAEVLIVRSKTKVTADLLEQAPALKIIGRSGTGVDNIDVAAATRRGVIVMNTPVGNSISAAEHTIGLILSLLRKIPQANNSVREGKWERHKFLGTELHGKVLGVIGYGKIGTEVVKRALSFNMQILVYDPFVSEALAQDLNLRLVKFEELLSQADIITLHVPLTASTRKLIDFRALVLMKHGAYLINTARGELVDESALLSALKSGKVAGAALDVFADEPQPNRELVSMPNVVATPHIGASTVEAHEKVGFDIALQIRDYFRDGIIRNAVNFPSISLAEYRKIAPYLDLGTRLGSFLSQSLQGRMYEVIICYFGEPADMDTHLICSSILVGMLKPILTERVTPVNALETAKERGIRVLESRSSEQRSHSNLISVRLKTDEAEKWVEGTVLHQNRLRLVSLSGIDVDAPLTGDMLILRNTDTPGVIGRVGTILGNNGINIANFALGRSEGTHEAIGVVNVDSEISAGALEELRALAQVLEVQVVRV